jgi:hypothetical protein
VSEWDEYREKFKKDNQEARRTKDRATQKKELVQSKSAELWESLKKAAITAAREINTSEQLLMFSPPQMAEPPNFELIYNPEGKRKAVRANYNPTSHLVKMSSSGISQNVNREYKITANAKTT